MRVEALFDGWISQLDFDTDLTGAPTDIWWCETQYCLF